VAAKAPAEGPGAYKQWLRLNTWPQKQQGFHYAILVSSDRRILDLARAALASVEDERLRFLVPDELIGFLDESVASPASARGDLWRPRIKRRGM